MQLHSTCIVIIKYQYYYMDSDYAYVNDCHVIHDAETLSSLLFSIFGDHQITIQLNIYIYIYIYIYIGSHDILNRK